MKIEKKQSVTIFRDALVSIFLYALPVLLMLLWFHLRGEHPWRH